ncbi:MAG: hypothetical protein RIA69_07395 [Cyclobacteriaceae bacterium]
MNLKTLLCVIALSLGIGLLNSANPIFIEAGKAVLVLSILGFYSVAQMKEVIHEQEFFDETIEKKMVKSEEHESQRQKVA